MRITFCLPQPSWGPVGGYKIVYEYANRLCERGHIVTIVHDSVTFAKKYFRYFPDNQLSTIIKKAFIKVFRNKVRWFQLNDGVRVINSVKCINDSYLPNADIIIATAIDTVEPVNKLSLSKGKKVCFVQDIENWDFDDEYVNYTYSLPFKYIVISDWIKERVDKHSLFPSELILNGLDFSQYYITDPIEERNPYTVSMLYHDRPHKGSVYGISALLKLKKEVPQLKVLMFGVTKRPKNLPDWIEYTRRATPEQLLKIYNQSAVFLCPTIDEGFGLTGAESMACGCALVSTEYKGVREYAVDNENAILCEKENPDNLCSAMKMLMDNNKVRIKLAYSGNKTIKKFDWNTSVVHYENFLERVVASKDN